MKKKKKIVKKQIGGPIFMPPIVHTELLNSDGTINRDIRMDGIDPNYDQSKDLNYQMLKPILEVMKKIGFGDTSKYVFPLSKEILRELNQEEIRNIEKENETRRFGGGTKRVYKKGGSTPAPGMFKYKRK